MVLGSLGGRSAVPKIIGWIAQLVEQRTENPRVGGSIPSPATSLNPAGAGAKGGGEKGVPSPPDE